MRRKPLAYSALESSNEPHTILSLFESQGIIARNIPLFECPQHNFEEIYYYRWWTIRKHIKKTPQGYVLSSFSSWTAYALYKRFLVDADPTFLIDRLPDLHGDFLAWEAKRSLELVLPG